MKIIESFDNTPNTNLLDVLGNSGYSLQSAIADIVDNSVAAKSKHVGIFMNYAGDESSISIVDDGCGMTLEKLKQASTIAFKAISDKRSKEDLGRFSTGINSASASMCHTLIIQSKSISDKRVNGILLDYKNMKSSGWTCSVIEIEESENLIKGDSGTAIIWKDLKPVANAKSRDGFFKKIQVVENHLSHVFFDYIEQGLKIYINNENNIIKGWDPFFTNNTKTTTIYSEKKSYKGSKVSIKIYILPPYNNLSAMEQAYMRGNGLSEQQGFYIYRNNRLIKEGGWLDLEDISISNKYDYARIRIDVGTDLDDYFEPNFLKNELRIPDDLKDLFKKIANKARTASRKNFNYMKAPSVAKGVKKDKQIPVWNCKKTSDGLLLSINDEHPIIKTLTEEMKLADKNRLFKLLSKNIPISAIVMGGISKKQTTYPNIRMEMEDLYSRLMQEGLSAPEIMKKMTSCEPFCLNDEYIGDLIAFFDDKGVL